MDFTKQINDDLKTAMRAHDKLSLSVIRMIKSELLNEQGRVGHELTEDDFATVINRAYKQRKDSIAEFKKGNRDDLVKETEAELKVVEKYMPKQLSDDELQEIINQVIEETGATSKADFGKVMSTLMPKVKGKADGAKVNEIVKNTLG
ncbi:GatB/YqeY domain-containing protein [Pediococcus acidilactici]|uniref:GatB/YqeY domain-containing protein n=1 Tax=Pediococcus acidilactici TaxID=1254 RepID=UPI001869B8A3|nr:GatB/YqeY domain-containing protein [Pediococcus acidilactici]MCH9266904.1 GatB/YqeY domain-containing protein [Pediococcus acidilactici]MCK2073790.1 GatB/YqeY domain-containing protein [Pediococcus acidilactici]MDV2602630.1 GatB/YqeY domain-containing protein [Pediococcus acidilactici]MDV2844054.1 GatB/YqeY domain-containing protein [Pediococcus acidilactici]QOP72825.1 GatB/YqeY domain-containing protein [Pediococcus acidilactici]